MPITSRSLWKNNLIFWMCIMNLKKNQKKIENFTPIYSWWNSRLKNCGFNDWMEFLKWHEFCDDRIFHQCFLQLLINKVEIDSSITFNFLNIENWCRYTMISDLNWFSNNASSDYKSLFLTRAFLAKYHFIVL